MKHAIAAAAGVCVAAVLCVTAAPLAAADPMTGTWTMHVTGGPHGDATMGLTLEQRGKQVTGTFVSGHGPDMAVAGEFSEGTLTLETTTGGSDTHVIFNAKLKEDGTLAGSISSPVGDMKWTAARKAADKKDGQ
jgi:hypothetical protein